MPAPGWHDVGAVAQDDTNQTGSASARIFVQRMIRNDVPPPGNLTTTPASTEVVLNWVEPEPTSAVGTVIERKLGRQGVWEEIATVETGVATYTDNTVESQTYYVYRIAALTTEGAISTYSNEAAAITRVAFPTYAVIDLGAALEQSAPPAAGNRFSQQLSNSSSEAIDAGNVRLRSSNANARPHRGWCNSCC